jgi:RNA polymerase sigma factor (sigma-70 family)
VVHPLSNPETHGENVMASVRRDAASRQIDRVFGEGTLAGLSDARLLERYTSDRDEVAFEALVRRHGPMVLGVCRRLLNDPNDADDAFQAAFLLLARKARSIRDEDCVGGWLHRVAWRIALQVKSDAARRRDQERRAAVRAGESVAPGPWHDDTVAVIHQEIDRLPDRYRRPVVLCYLEAMTYSQAAGQLHWSEATTRSRLARARELLRARLTRRGVALAGAGLILDGAASPGMAAAVPAALLRETVRAARHIVLGESAAVGAVSSTTIILMKQAARAMMIARLKAVAAVALVVATLTGLATGLGAMGIGGDDPRPAGTSRAAKVDATPPPVIGRAKAAEGETLAFRGRVLAPDGRPAGGAGVYTVAPRADGNWAAPVLRTRAAADGSFHFDLRRAELDAAGAGQPWSMLTVLASADGLGPDWVALVNPPDEELVLRLVDDSVPIAGRILDLQGRPVVGARVTLGRIADEGAAGIDPYLS